jgi:hypothetical protein
MTALHCVRPRFSGTGSGPGNAPRMESKRCSPVGPHSPFAPPSISPSCQAHSALGPCPFPHVGCAGQHTLTGLDSFHRPSRRSASPEPSDSCRPAAQVCGSGRPGRALRSDRGQGAGTAHGSASESAGRSGPCSPAAASRRSGERQNRFSTRRIRIAIAARRTLAPLAAHRPPAGALGSS